MYEYSLSEYSFQAKSFQAPFKLIYNKPASNPFSINFIFHVAQNILLKSFPPSLTRAVFFNIALSLSQIL